MADLVERLQAAQLRGNADPADIGPGGLLDEAAKRVAELERIIYEYCAPMQANDSDAQIIMEIERRLAKHEEEGK